MDKTEAHLRTNKISSRIAPASSAARMWRRVPSGLRFVQAAFKPTLTNSINLRGRTPLVHGLVLILKQASAHFGSHSRSVSKGESQGPAGRSVASPMFSLSSLVIFFMISLRLSCGFIARFSWESTLRAANACCGQQASQLYVAHEVRLLCLTVSYSRSAC